MKLTKIRKFPGTSATLAKASQRDLKELIKLVEIKMLIKGFEVQGEIVNSSSIKLGSNKMQFRVIPEKLGYNTRVNPHLGMRRTRCPSWEQRVDFNRTLNRILDDLGYSANVFSGPFTIRQGLEHFQENDWRDQKPDYIRQNESQGFKVLKGDLR